MKEIRSLIGWIGVLGMLCFCLFCAWDFVSFNLRECERRISALEASARPLFIVDRYSSVEVLGQEVYTPGQTPTLAEEMMLAKAEE